MGALWNISLINADCVDPQSAGGGGTAEVTEGGEEVGCNREKGARNGDVGRYSGVAPDVGDGFVGWVRGKSAVYEFTPDGRCGEHGWGDYCQAEALVWRGKGLVSVSVCHFVKKGHQKLGMNEELGSDASEKIYKN